MLITTAVEPCDDGMPHDHLVFILWNAESHGLIRVDPEPFKCDCGATLTADALDRGDEFKTSWPRAASWRDNGDKKCPECEEYPSISREQYFRARGYGATPKSDIKRVTSKQREEALREAEHTCYVCDDEAAYVKRIIPPRHGGNRELVNLIALCSHHHEDYGHPFADLLFPQEWYLIDLEWEAFARPLREKLAKADPNAIAVRKLDSLLSKGLPDNPYPYAPR